MMPAHELTTVRMSRTEANHAADLAQRACTKRPTEATSPTSADPTEAPLMTINSRPVRPTADGSALKVRIQAPHRRRRTEPPKRADDTQCGTFTSEARL